jgi:hypothetical protein
VLILGVGVLAAEKQNRGGKKVLCQQTLSFRWVLMMLASKRGRDAICLGVGHAGKGP